jgi:hypothetical protein
MPSTVIRQMDYDAVTSTLKVSFVSGQVYVYKDVPETVYKDLAASRVKGRYLRFFIKDKYSFERVDAGA